jgi:uncharacterized membrane protein
MGAQAIAWLTLAGPIALDGPTVPLLWSVQGALLMWLGGRMKDLRLTVLSIAFIAGGLLGAVDHISTYRPGSLLVTADAAVAAAHLGTLFVVALVVTRGGTPDDEWRPIFGMALMVVATFLTLGWISREAAFEVQRVAVPERAFAAVQFTYSVVWAGYAALLLVGGILRKVPWARYFGIVLFALTIIKMVSVDVWLLEVLYRMVAFIGLGALLLVCSLMYNRFRELLVGES